MEKLILVVDDEPCIADSIALKIKRLKHENTYRVSTCNSARLALSMTEEQTFWMIITDIRMPFLGGIWLIKELRHKGYPGFILVISGHDDFDYVREAFVSGADDYMRKPIAVSELDVKFQEFFCRNQEEEPGGGNVSMENAVSEGEGQKRNRNHVMAYAVQYISEHYRDSELTMEDVARHISVSYSYFSVLFRKEMETTFPSYLRKMRIEKAIELLEDPTLKIADICYQVGFKYPQQFSNDFKKVTGVYPSQYVAGKE